MQLAHMFTILAIASLAVGTPLNGGSTSPTEGVEARDLVGTSPAEGVEVRDLMKRACYSGGKTWGDNRDHAIDRAGRWCSGNGGSGSYRAGLVKSGCYNSKHGKNRYNFEIQNKTPNTRSLDSAGCNTLLQDRIKNCNRGGRAERDGWSFRQVHCFT